jgi:hypothetical protein
MGVTFVKRKETFILSELESRETPSAMWKIGNPQFNYLSYLFVYLLVYLLMYLFSFYLFMQEAGYLTVYMHVM